MFIVLFDQKMYIYYKGLKWNIQLQYIEIVFKVPSEKIYKTHKLYNLYTT